MKQQEKTTTQKGVTVRKDYFQPKTRLAEILATFIVNRRRWLSHCTFATDLLNVNSHKRIGELKELGIRFEEKNFKFTNRFGRRSTVKKFRIISPRAEAVKIFNQINGESE